MTTRKTSSVRVTDVNLPDDGPMYPDDGPEDGPTKQDGDEHKVAMAGHHQQRAMAAALRDHGLTTDAGVYDFLSAFLGREISSRKELTTTEAAHIIRDLIDNPPSVGPTAEQWAALAAPFPADQVEKKPQLIRRGDENKGRCDNNQFSADGYYCGGWHARSLHLDYIGHAGVTARLNDVVTPAGWSWEPVAFNQDGTPNVGREFWIRLTVLGVSKYGVGDDFGGSAKQAIGDALRNAGMRFGIATYLWSKSEAALAMKQATDEHVPPQDREDPPASAWAPLPVAPPADDLTDMGTADLLLLVDQYATEQGQSFDAFTHRWRGELGPDVKVDDLDDLPPEVVANFVRRVRHHLAQTGAST